MAMKAKHAFGNLSDVEKALKAGKIDCYDILFLDGDTEPKIGWIDANGIFRLVENEADFSELEAIIATKANVADVKALEAEVATKVDAEEVDVKIDEASARVVASANEYTNKMVEAAMDEHLTKKYEITDVPVGTLVNINESEIRIMASANAQWVKQNVGEGGDANSYYCTLKTYCPDGAVGYIEHLGNQVDTEILTDLKTDEYGFKYQPTWLALAKYDEATSTWTYYGKNSSKSKMVGWDYRIDWFDADGVMIESDSIRINLSNEDCHYAIEPYYVGSVKSYVDTQIEEKIAEVESAYEVIEF
jgi:hypothetical protein